MDVARVQAYFARNVAERAAQSISDGSEIALEVRDPGGTTPLQLTFTRQDGHNQILSRPAQSPHLTFAMTPAAFEAILANPSEDIGEIGVGIAKMILERDPQIKVSIQIHAGFLTLWSKGYFGVLKAGGGSFASYLATQGFSGIDAIKAALKKK